MNDFIEGISDFIFVENNVEKADVIFIPGSSETLQGELAARLYAEGFAPLCIVSGGTGIATKRFLTPASKREIYNADYKSEFEFLRDVLIKNGVAPNAICGDDKSSYTRENAQFSKILCDEANLTIGRAILVCKAFHARRALTYYQLAFPDTQFFVATVASRGITRENWFKTEVGVKRVLGELRRCGEQFGVIDIAEYEEKVGRNRE